MPWFYGGERYSLELAEHRSQWNAPHLDGIPEDERHYTHWETTEELWKTATGKARARSAGTPSRCTFYDEVAPLVRRSGIQDPALDWPLVDLGPSTLPAVADDPESLFECMICMDRPPDTVVKPCNCVVVCAQCSKGLQRTAARDRCVKCQQLIDHIEYLE